MAADRDCLFKNLFEAAVLAHVNYFSSSGLTVRHLTEKELTTYPLNIAQGWRLYLNRSGTRVTVDYLLDTAFPFSKPQLYLVSPDPAKEHWAHVERGGNICLFRDTDCFSVRTGKQVPKTVLAALCNIIDINYQQGKRRRRYTETRHLWCNCNDVVWALMECLEKGPAYAACFDALTIVGRNKRQLRHWCRNYFDSDLEDSDLHAAYTLYISAGENHFHWHQPPETGETLRSWFGNDAAQVVKSGGLLLIVIETETTPLHLSVKCDPKDKNKLQRMRVARVDKKWLHFRGGLDYVSELDKKRIAIVGCGSLGAGVAELIVRGGVPNLVLIDPDVMQWENATRHLLAARYIGKYKVTALEQHLLHSFPNLQSIEIYNCRWEQLVSEQPHTLRDCDLVVSTIAQWPSEAGLSLWCKQRCIDIVFGWLEPLAFAGHAISQNSTSGCLACLMNDFGRFDARVTDWPLDKSRRLVGGCHESYLPYPYINTVPVQQLIAALSLETLMKEGSFQNQRVSWVGDLSRVTNAGGRVTDDWMNFFERGDKSHIKNFFWHASPLCTMCGGP